MARSISVLHVEDDPDFADLASTFLQREDDRFTVRTATDPSEGLEILSQRDIDCVVSDYEMPGQNGIEFLETVRETHPDLPFVLYTGKGSEEVASDAISTGVTDYLQKEGGTSQYTVLANRILNSVEKYRAQTELADREHRLNLFFEQSPLGVIRWDDAFNFARLNETAEEILGYSQGELVGRPWEVVIPEEHREHIGEVVVEDLLANEGGYHSINENVRKDGERIVCEWHNWVVTDETDEVVAVFSQFNDITERKEQRAEFERYRAIIEAANTAVISIDETNTILSANPAVEDTFGYAPDEIVGEPLTRLMPEEEAERHRAAFDRYIETGEPTLAWDRLEFTGRHRDGSRIPLSVSLAEVSSEGDRFFVGLIQDISERNRMEAELQEERDLLTDIMETTPVGIAVVDVDGTLSYVNERAEAIYGRPWDEIAEFTHDDPRWDLIDENGEPFDAGDTPFERVMSGTKRIQGQVVGIRHPSGKRRWLSVNGAPSIDEEGNLDQAVFAFQDITERRELEARLEEVYDRITDAFYALDEEFRFTHVNERTEELMRASADELLGNTLWDMYPEAAETDVVWDAFHAAMDLQIPQSFDVYYDPLDFHAEATVYPSESGLSVFFRDVTEQKEYERQLERQNDQLDEFTGVVSHDLQNPLNVARGRVEQARGECDSEHLDSAAGALERMDALIQDLLTLAREGNELGDIETVDMAELAEHCWQNIAPADASVVIECERDVMADQTRFQQLLENLIRNAVEHGGDDVTVTIGELDSGFFVEDDGPGIPEGERDRVFETGYSTSSGGTGFGLSIVKQVVDAHGWEIQVTEGSDGGARFEISGAEITAE